MSAAGRAGIRRSLKLLAGTACLLPGLAPAAGPFEGTWQMQSGATTFGEEHPLELMLERGEFQRAGCTPAIDVAADGSDQPVRGQPLFDSMAVKIVAPLRVGSRKSSPASSSGRAATPWRRTRSPWCSISMRNMQARR